MIYYDTSEFWKIIFHWRGGFISRYVLFRAFLATLSGLAAAVCVHLEWPMVEILHDFIGQVSFLVSLLISFRITSAFQHYDKGAAAVGALLTHSRVLLAQMCCAVTVDDIQERHDVLLTFRRLLVSMMIICIKHIRQDEALEDMLRSGLLTSEEHRLLTAKPMHTKSGKGPAEEMVTVESSTPERSRPIFSLLILRQTIHTLGREGQIPLPYVNNLDGNVTKIAEDFAALEAIALSPIPFSYSQFIKLLVVVYTTISPWSYASKAEWWTPALAFFLAFLLYGAESLAQEIENPFGDDPNDIDVFSRLRAANDDLADVLVFALGSQRVDRFDTFFTLHRMERRVSKRISAVEVKKDFTILHTSPEPDTDSTALVSIAEIAEERTPLLRQ